jgi:hypothetical protein
MIGNLARIILELGLNRKMVLNRTFPDPIHRFQAINTIWAAYVLNEHLSYALGLSMAMPDFHLDLSFPDPVSSIDNHD